MTDLIQIDGIVFRVLRAFLASAFVLLASHVFAQDNEDIIRVDTELVAFEVTVADRNGKPVAGLKPDDFRVYENGVERPIDFFQPIVRHDDSRPLSIVFALDVSGSMTEAEIERLRSAMQSFIARLADYNSYFAVVSFAMDVKTLQSFTNRREKLEKTFDRLARDQDGLSTHAYDAIDESVRLIVRKSPKIVKGRLPKRAVVLVSDGFPVGDTVAPETLIERANDAETTVYSVILPSYSRMQTDKKPLITPLEASGVIERTGGKSFYATDKSFNALFEALADEITASYAIAFYPEKGGVAAGVPRKVSIRSREGLTVRQNRSEYEPK